MSTAIVGLPERLRYDARRERREAAVLYASQSDVPRGTAWLGFIRHPHDRADEKMRRAQRLEGHALYLSRRSP